MGDLYNYIDKPFEMGSIICGQSSVDVHSQTRINPKANTPGLVWNPESYSEMYLIVEPLFSDKFEDPDSRKSLAGFAKAFRSKKLAVACEQRSPACCHHENSAVLDMLADVPTEVLNDIVAEKQLNPILTSDSVCVARNPFDNASN